MIRFMNGAPHIIFVLEDTKGQGFRYAEKERPVRVPR